MIGLRSIYAYVVIVLCIILMKFLKEKTMKIERLITPLILTSACLLTGCTTGNHNLKDELVEKEMDISMAIQPNIDSKHISTHVNDGIMQVAGFVDNKNEYTEVSNKMNSFKNNYRVINNVKILPDSEEPANDRHLERSVRKVLSQANYPTEDISVQARNGQLILSGFVNRHINLNEITETTKNIPGVDQINNYLLYHQ